MQLFDYFRQKKYRAFCAVFFIKGGESTRKCERSERFCGEIARHLFKDMARLIVKIEFN